MNAKPRALKNEQIGAVDRQRQALELRKCGHTYQQIARALNYRAASGAWHATQRGLKTTLREPADELRQLELARLDTLHHALWDRAIAGNLRAVDAVLRIMKRRASLLGMDAPKRLGVSVEMTMRAMAERMAVRYGLDASALVAEAEQILGEMRGEGGRPREA